MISRPVEIQKIDHLAVGDSVDKIADGATEDKSQGSDQTDFSVRQAPDHHDNKSDRQHGKKNQKRYSKMGRASGKHPECRAGITDIGQTE